MKTGIAEIISDKVIGNMMGKLLNLDRSMTPKEVRAYAAANRKMEEEDEIVGAISTLEAAGYTVIPPKHKRK